jgi:predicted glycogen debranching enzyme
MSSSYAIETHGQLEPHLQQEWLLTNGLGGYSMSTVVGCNTRKYHGLLIAATLPPVGRMMCLSRIGEVLLIDGHQPQHEFSVSQFPARFQPQGWQYLKRFELGDTALWEYDVAGVRIVKEVLHCWGHNGVGIRYTVTPPAGRRVTLRLLPFAGLRDFHSTRRAGHAPFESNLAGNVLTARTGDLAVSIAADKGTAAATQDWWYDHHYAIEVDRGQDHIEDLFNPGSFTLESDAPATITLWAGLEADPTRDWDAELHKRSAARWQVAPQASQTIARLTRAAQDFVVRRQSPDKQTLGTTVIAGYPWFADWGRDTMISLPGLMLATRRFDEARQVLSVFARYVSQGMIPNKFDDYTDEPSYNTVDASLWFINACFQYRDVTKDNATFDQVLKPACAAILDGYRQGTRYGIHMDEADGLITQGDASTQLTWMDAKTGGIAFTPRQGKPVEINALWHNALVLMGQTDLAARVAENYRKTFWISPFRGLYDVVEGARKDGATRPNQIFAVSLPHSPLTRDQQAAVVEVVRRELLTPFGLRTLSRSDPNFCGLYCGEQMQRDRAYHNGTVWAWLLGPFLEAYLKVHDFSAEAKAQARQWLAPLIEHMNTSACVGQISECFEGQEPHRPVAAPAQAWSVAETLRVAVMLGV